MHIDPTAVRAFEAAVLKAKHILVFPHKNPDGDALGATAALTTALQRAGRRVTFACVDDVPPDFSFVPGTDHIVQDFNEKDIDLIISVDSGDLKQTGWDVQKPELFTGSRPIIKIDHHACAQHFGDIQLVYEDVPASAFIVTELLETLGMPITSGMATALLTGLFTDTGSFKHNNTTVEVLRMAARLQRLGGDISLIRKHVFSGYPVSSLKLWGRVLSSIKLTSAGAAVAVVRTRDFEETATTHEDLPGVTDFVAATKEAKWSLILSERGDVVKGSLRTKYPEVNVANIASSFGGGGHTMAAGFAVPGRIVEEQRWKIIPAGDNTEGKVVA